RAGDERVGLYSAEVIEIGGRRHSIWLLNDITEQRKLEGQLRQAQKMEAVGQLTGGIAHDFNNLLTVILSSAELMAGELPDGATTLRSELDDLRAAANRGASLVRKMLALSRDGDLVLKPARLQDQLESTTAMLRHVLPESIETTLRMDPDVAPVMLDAAAFEQILLNLATNARDAMPNGGQFAMELDAVTLDEVTCEVQGWGRAGRYARVTVADTGVGMDERTRAKIFEPFFTTKPHGKGTGLGMAMAYGLMRQHDGFINVYSEPQRGTRMRLYFPATEQVPEAPDAAIRPQPRGGTETILVVEDDAGIRRVARRVLEGHGYTVRIAEDGRQALDILKAEGAVDLVISDVIMPRLGGTELFQVLERSGHDFRFLFTSGYTGAELDQAGASVPMSHFLPKPWTIPDLLHKVRGVLDEMAVTT
ncbi:MAG TPA: ATP-binding protein, partial [Longimicrobiales bacterium]|nr:ATP-binding protein [Longimicrobiales bacterium]